VHGKEEFMTDGAEFDAARFVSYRNKAKKQELLEVIDSNPRERLLSDQIWGFDVTVDASGGIGYIKVTYKCTFDSGPVLYCEGRVLGPGASVAGIWGGRGEMNVSPESLVGTQSSLQVHITIVAIETTFWAMPSSYQGVCGAGGVGITVFTGGGTGIWTQLHAPSLGT
jgi:hypothetical protein